MGMWRAVKKITNVKSVAARTNWIPLKFHTVIILHCDVGQFY